MVRFYFHYSGSPINRPGRCCPRLLRHLGRRHIPRHRRLHLDLPGKRVHSDFAVVTAVEVAFMSRVLGLNVAGLGTDGGHFELFLMNGMILRRLGKADGGRC